MKGKHSQAAPRPNPRLVMHAPSPAPPHLRKKMLAQATLEAMLAFLFLLSALSLLLPAVLRLHSANYSSLQSSYGSNSLASSALLIGALSTFSYGDITTLPSSLYAHGVAFSTSGNLVRAGVSQPGGGGAIQSGEGFAYCIAQGSNTESTYGVHDEIPQ